MKFSRSRFLTALAGLAALPFRRLALQFRILTLPPPPAPKTAGPTRAGPWLGDWRQSRWVPVTKSVHPMAQRLIRAVGRHEMVSLRYRGGSTPGQKRNFTPTLIFQLSGCGPLYVAGYCHRRHAERVLRVDRIVMNAEEDPVLCITE